MFDFLDVYLVVARDHLFGRVVDVSLGTLRIIFVSRRKYKAPLIGFVEVFIWVVIISQILSVPMTCWLISYTAVMPQVITWDIARAAIAYGIVLCRIYTQRMELTW